MDIYTHIGLRNRDVLVIINKEATNKASTSKPKNDLPPKETSKNVIEPKGKERKKIIQGTQIRDKLLAI